MQSNLPKASPHQFIVGMAAFVIVVAGMKAAQGIIVLFFMSAFLAVICAPVIYMLKQFHFPDWAAIVTVIIGGLLLLMGLGAVAGASISEFSNVLPEYQAKLQQQLNTAIHWLSQKGVQTEGLGEVTQNDVGAILKFAGSILNELGLLLSNGVLILLIVSFMLFEASSFPAKLRAISSNPDQAIAQLNFFLGNMNRYIAIKSVISLFTGVVVTIGTALLGLEYVLVWGTLAFLLNYIPTIGSIIAALPAILFAIVELGFGSAVGVAVFYLAINTIVGNIIEPKYMGKGLGLSPLVVFLSLLFWGWVLGPLGMLLSVPLTVSIKLAADAHPESQWLAVFLGTAAENK